MHPQPVRSEGFSRQATQGYAQIPNSIVENQSLMTPAELRLVIIVLRRGENTVSDRHWQDWTGLEPRIKRHAIQGLKSKGLTVRGRGDSAKYYFERDRWDSWVRTRPRHDRAHTTGRSKSVTAKTGMQVHPECRERGCSRLCDSEEKAQTQVIPFPATEVRQQVAKTEPDPPPKDFPLTLSAVQKYFPHVGPDFITLLRSKISIRYTDTQLAKAIHTAHKSSQQSEGLFLLTVPAKLAAVIATKAHLTETEKRQVKLAKQVLADPTAGWSDDAIQQAHEILHKHGG